MSNSFFITSERLAEVLALHPETVRRQARRGYYKGALGGGDKPWRFRKTAIEKQLGLEPGALN